MTDLVKPVTWLLGVVLLLVGIAGFFMNPVLVFDVNTLHNIVHLASGAAGLIAASMGYMASRMYLFVFGLVYALVAVLGLLGVQAIIDLLQINTPDNYLHLAIAVVCLGVGFASRKA